MDCFKYATNRSFNIANNGKSMTKLDDDARTVYGSKVIGFNTKGIHKWRIKIIKETYGFGIGIDEAGKLWKNDRFFNQSKSINYAYASNGPKWESGEDTEFISKYAPKDIVEMVLNMNNKTLSFSKNDCPLKKAFNIKQTNIGYSLAVSCRWKGSEMELLSYIYMNSNENDNDDLKWEQKQKENKKLKGELNEIQKLNESQIEKLAKHENEMVSLKNECECQQNKMNELNAKIILNLEDEILRLKNKTDRIKSNESSQQKQVIELKRENEKLKTEINAIKESYQSQIQKMEKQHDSQQNNLIELNAKNKSLRESINCKQKEISRLKNENNECKSNESFQQKQVVQLKRENLKLTNELKSKQENILNLKEEILKLKNENNELHTRKSEKFGSKTTYYQSTEHEKESNVVIIIDDDENDNDKQKKPKARPWKQCEKDDLLKMNDEGKSVKIMSDKLQRTESAIRQKLRLLLIEKEKKRQEALTCSVCSQLFDSQKSLKIHQARKQDAAHKKLRDTNMSNKGNKNTMNVNVTIKTGKREKMDDDDNEDDKPSKKKRKLNKSKLDWDLEECANWVGALGDGYKKYITPFKNNGISGEFLNNLDIESLEDIVQNKLHRRKIMFEWKKL